MNILRFTKIDIGVDSPQVVHGIATSHTSNVMENNLITKIRSYFQHDRDIQISHVYCEANLCVDALAKQIIHHPNDTCFFKSYPTFIEHLMEGDLSGIPVSRLISV